MADFHGSPKLGATPGKLALIGVLAIVLVAVIAVQWGSSADAPLAKVDTDAPNRRRPAVRPPGAEKPAEKSESAQDQPATTVKPWPKRTLPEVIAFDPFQPPADLAESTLAPPSGEPELPLEANLEGAAAKSSPPASDPPQPDLAATLARLKEAGVGMVLTVGDERVATIGSKVVRIGDLLEGFRVAKIGAEGIVLVKVDRADLNGLKNGANLDDISNGAK